ncbi:MAG: hypothetical protein QW412_01240, partial [Candidatus Aenigmatarchaeota archaeon]
GIVKRAYLYRNLGYTEFLEVCKQLQQLGLIFLNKEIRKKRRGFEYYFTQLSTIPEVKQYKIFNSLDNSFVGVLDEEFVALHAEIGSNFIVKGEAWRILDIKEDKIIVEPTLDIEAAIPAWEGELIPVPFEVSQEVGRLRSLIAKMLENGEDAIKKLLELYPIDKNCAKKMVETIKKQLNYGTIPDDKKILIEDYENTIIIHSCFGSLTNETLGRFISALLTQRLGSIGLKVDPYRIILQFQNKNVELIKEVIFKTNPELLRNYLEISLSKSDLFEWKFVHVAKRFGSISKNADYGKTTIKRIIDDYAGSPIFKETLKELEVEKLDLERAKEILKKIQSGEIEVVFKPGLSFLGRVGIKHKYLEVLGPTKPEPEIFKLFKQRLLATSLRFVCLNCAQWSQLFVLKNIPEDLKCRVCGARLLGIARPNNQSILRIVKKKIRNLGITKEEEKQFERMRKIADLFLTYGKKVAYCLAGRGIGPDTTIRILSKFHRNEEELFKSILEAERNYLKTRKYWSV